MKVIYCDEMYDVVKRNGDTYALEKNDRIINVPMSMCHEVKEQIVETAVAEPKAETATVKKTPAKKTAAKK